LGTNDTPQLAGEACGTNQMDGVLEKGGVTVIWRTKKNLILRRVLCWTGITATQRKGDWEIGTGDLIIGRLERQGCRDNLRKVELKVSESSTYGRSRDFQIRCFLDDDRVFLEKNDDHVTLGVKYKRGRGTHSLARQPLKKSPVAWGRIRSEKALGGRRDMEDN